MIRDDMLAMYSSAISAVEGRRVVANALPPILNDQLSTEEIQNLQIISIGKAADAMLQGALSCFPKQSPRSLLISKHGHCSLQSMQKKNITCVESAHPIPNEESLKAGQTLINFLEAGDLPCLFLISGGTSSLVEVLADNWELIELQELTEWMLANAYDINQINAVRSRISKIKSGGLWRILGSRKVICLMISDVPNDDPAIIGSGLLFHSIFAPTNLHFLPQKWIDKLLLLEKPQAPDSFFWQIVASNTQAKEAVESKAKELGYQTKQYNALLQDDAIKTAKYCIQQAKINSNHLLIFGAETTVVLPKIPGKGGRNQHLALAAAIEISEREGCYLLSAGTDGTDGMTEDTGAIVDSQTIERAKLDGFIASQSLLNADAGHFLAASGDLISTGVTGTNVMDLIIVYCKVESS